jgi:hypothetical protein
MRLIAAPGQLDGIQRFSILNPPCQMDLLRAAGLNSAGQTGRGKTPWEHVCPCLESQEGEPNSKKKAADLFPDQRPSSLVELRGFEPADLTMRDPERLTRVDAGTVKVVQFHS